MSEREEGREKGECKYSLTLDEEEPPDLELWISSLDPLLRLILLSSTSITASAADSHTHTHVVNSRS